MRKLTETQKVHPHWRELQPRAFACQKWSPKHQRETWVVWRPDKYPHDSKPYANRDRAAAAAERINKVLWP